MYFGPKGKIFNSEYKQYIHYWIVRGVGYMIMLDNDYGEFCCDDSYLEYDDNDDD